MKKPLAALALAAATVATLAVPAGAAVPKTPANQTVPCHDGSRKSAGVWWTSQDPQDPSESGVTQLAAKNPCKQWLTLRWGVPSESAPGEQTFFVAPGVHFNWTFSSVSRYVVVGYGPPLVRLVKDASSCHTGDTATAASDYSYEDVRVYSYRDLRTCARP